MSHDGLGRRRIGIVGFGNLGKYLSQRVSEHPELELAFVWNRSKEAFEGFEERNLILEDLENCEERRPDLIVEVAHPTITQKVPNHAHCEWHTF